ncbi:MAG TPA: N-acetyltransferase, partial [Halieaceae bacterium]|nr:N-acetyltransferase [Halieaceae bacterium]
MSEQKQAADRSLAVVPLAGRRDLGRFIDLPRLLYADDPCFIAPLAFEQRQRFSPKSPYAAHARWQGWLAL